MNVEKTGAYLASLRKGRDMTQQQVADILGVSNKTVSKWESGAGLPDIGALPALAALYGVTADDILAGETRPRAVSDDNVQREVETYLERRWSWGGASPAGTRRRPTRRIPPAACHGGSSSTRS